MDQLNGSLSFLVGFYSPYFRPEVFQMFRLMLGGWIVCLGRRTVSRVWESTGRSQYQDHSAAFRLFSEAVWNWDEVCRILILQILATLLPGCEAWVVVDDTLCHKRGGCVAFGGMFLDAVLSTKKKKIFRYGNNWVTLGLVVQLPFRADRYYCLNVLWRIAEKQGDKPRAQHRSKPQLAREMIEKIAGWLPGTTLRVVADVAYIGRHLLKNRPQNVEFIGPIRSDAALTEPCPANSGRRKKGERLPTPQEILNGDDSRWPTEAIRFMHLKGEKELAVKVVRNACWYDVAGPAPLMFVLIRDPQGEWRDEHLLSTDASLSVQEILAGYCRRWSVEVAYADSKGMMGFHEPEVWCSNSVQRAHPMAWFVGSLVVLWYVLHGECHPTPQRHRPWYKHKPEVTFADMLATCRYQLWETWLANSTSDAELAERRAWLMEFLATAA
jgi:hypothetical protein